MTCAICNKAKRVLAAIRDRKARKIKMQAPTAMLLRSPSQEFGTLGRIALPGGFHCYTIELPWRDNEQGRSCIPAGEYSIGYRKSPVVERTTRGEFTHGYEVEGVPGRTFIMFHVANSMFDLEGCIGTGAEKSSWGHGAQEKIPPEVGQVPTVTDSLATYRRFTQAMADDGVERIEIDWRQGRDG